MRVRAECIATVDGGARKAGPAARQVVQTSAGMLCALGALTAIQLFHGSGPAAYDTLWAEDGRVFLYGALHGQSIFATHAGYAQLAPRLFGWASARLSLDDAAAWFAVAPAIATSLLAIAVYWLSDFLVRSRWLRAVLAASFVLPPVLVGETLANSANLQWPLLAACFWALARRPEGWRDGLVAGLIAVTTALSTGVAFVYVPLAVFVVIVRRERVATVVPTLFVAGCAAQAWLSLSTAGGAARGSSSFTDLLLLYTVRVGGSAALGERVVAKAWTNLGVGLAVAVGLAGAVVLGVLLTKSDVLGRLWGGAALTMSVLVFGATAYYRGTDPLRLTDGVWNGSGGRYVGCALQLLVAAIVILVARARLEPDWRRAIVGLLVTQALVAPAIAWRPETGRSHGPRWAASLSAARRMCRSPGVPWVGVPITPPDWFVPLECSRLR